MISCNRWSLGAESNIWTNIMPSSFEHILTRQLATTSSFQPRYSAHLQHLRMLSDIPLITCNGSLLGQKPTVPPFPALLSSLFPLPAHPSLRRRCPYLPHA